MSRVQWARSPDDITVDLRESSLKPSPRIVDICAVDAAQFPAPMAKRRAKSVGKTQALLGSEATCHMYGFGVRGPDPQRSLLWMIGGAIGFCVVLALLTGIILIPGLLLIAIVRWNVNTPRGVAITSRGIAVTKESAVDARPTAVLERVSLDAMFVVAATTTSHVCVPLGNEQVWLRRKEYEILVAAARGVRQAV